MLILNYDSTEIVPGGAGQRGQQRRGARRGRRGRRRRPGRTRPAGGCSTRCARASTCAGSSVRAGSARRRRRASSPAASTRRSSRSSASIARRAPSSTKPDRARGCGAAAEAPPSRCDALLVSDYGSGLVTPALVAQAQKALRRRARAAAPVLVDSRYALLRFRGMTACTPNESEVEQLLRRPHRRERARRSSRPGASCCERTRAPAVLITRGSRGMALFEPDRPTVHIPIVGSDQIADVTGAGDTVIATMTLALAAGATFLEAAHLANYAGGLVVMKRGTATVSADELRHAVLTDLELRKSSPASELVARGRRRSPRRADDRVRQRLLRSPARRPRPLPAGRGRGSRSPRRRGQRRCRRPATKGPGRPILRAADRAELVAALRGVDYVVDLSGADRHAAADAAAAGRPLQGHRLHCRHRAGARDRARRTAAASPSSAIPKDHSTRDLLARIRG